MPDLQLVTNPKPPLISEIGPRVERAIVARWRREPDLLDRIIEAMSGHGQLSIAAELCHCTSGTVQEWKDQGKMEAEAYDRGVTDEHTPLMVFFWKVREMRALYEKAHLEALEKTADTNEMAYAARMWLLENTDPDRKFVKTNFVQEEKTVRIIVETLNGEAWRSGGRVRAIEESKQAILEEVEDF